MTAASGLPVIQRGRHQAELVSNRDRALDYGVHPLSLHDEPLERSPRFPALRGKQATR